MRGQECVGGEASASSLQAGSCHMCVYVPVWVKNKNSKAIQPFVKNISFTILCQEYVEAFLEHTLMHTHLTVSAAKKKFAIWTSLHIALNRPSLNPSCVTLYCTHTHTQV